MSQELVNVNKQLKLAMEDQDREAEAIMREERERYAKLMWKLEREKDSLKATLDNLLAEREERVALVEQQQESHAAELNKIIQRQQRLEDGMTRRGQRSSGLGPSPSSIRGVKRMNMGKQGVRDIGARIRIPTQLGRNLDAGSATGGKVAERRLIMASKTDIQ
ncbi:hypothetical protein BJY04DRAFT_212253 [Aspergillus karnatakaensis]|uniref:uncharacterized protein n=1 Tax=Aspergillus karnatakaensis TaxID=1810916 RepID=UPI003CCD58D5